MGIGSATCDIITVKREIATSSEMPSSPVIEGEVDNDQKAASTHGYNSTVDQYEQIELVAEVIADGHGKSTNATMGAENVDQGQAQFWGLLFRWILAAAICLLHWYYCIGTIKQDHGYVWVSVNLMRACQ